MVAQHGIDAERRAQELKLIRYRFRLDARAADHAALVILPADDEVARDEDEVGRLLVHTRDDLAQTFQTHVRRADVEVCEQRDLQALMLRVPPRHGETHTPDDGRGRLQPERPQRQTRQHDERGDEHDSESRFEEAGHLRGGRSLPEGCLECHALLHADIGAPVPPRLYATTSARMASATSSGDTAPMSRPTGARTSLRTSSSTPDSRRRPSTMLVRRRMPIMPT